MWRRRHIGRKVTTDRDYPAGVDSINPETGAPGVALDLPRLDVMRRQPEVSVVIPAYNEESRIGPTIREAVGYFRDRDSSFELIVVDDGSRDGTGSLVRQLADEYSDIRLIRLPENRGKGYAVRVGVVNSHGRRVLFMDADGATPMAEIERLEHAIEGGADLAIGSRALRGDGVRVRAKLHRRLIGRVFHGLVTLLTVRGFRDTQCGFKLFRSVVAYDLFSRMRMNGFSFDVELLMMARRGGYRVAEIPVNWVHKPGSRINLALDSLRMARDLCAIRIRALRGAYDEPGPTPAGHAARLSEHRQAGPLERVTASRPSIE